MQVGQFVEEGSRIEANQSGLLYNSLDTTVLVTFILSCVVFGIARVRKIILEYNQIHWFKLTLRNLDKAKNSLRGHLFKTNLRKLINSLSKSAH